MKTAEKTFITVEATINAPVEKVWQRWVHPHHIVHWNQASEDWHTTYAENDLKKGGRFTSRMEEKKGKTGFDYSGTYDEIKINELLSFTLDDGRKVEVKFRSDGSKTHVTEAFEADDAHPADMQRSGWQAILDNFKKYVETTGELDHQNYQITINAKPEKVYKVLIEEKSYNEWTKVFNASSRFEGSWNKGERIRFIGTDKEGNEGGMISRIKENIPNRYISIEHVGEFQNGKDNLEAHWSGSLENYTLTAKNDHTVLDIDMDVVPEYISFFNETWPEALKKVKKLSER